MGFADKFAKQGHQIDKLISSHSEGKSSIDQIMKKAETNQAAPTSMAGQNPEIDPKKATMADLIYLVKGVDDGRNAWYYVLVDRLKVSLFLKALNDDIIHLENYGVILYSAYGDEPPQEITDKLKKEYGIK